MDVRDTIGQYVMGSYHHMNRVHGGSRWADRIGSPEWNLFGFYLDVMPLKNTALPSPDSVHETYNYHMVRLYAEGFRLSSWGDERPDERYYDVYKHADGRRVSIEFTGVMYNDVDFAFTVVRH